MTEFDAAETDDVVVRRATRADLLDVLRIERTCFSEPWPYSAFELFVDEPAFLVAARGTDILGYVVADVMPNHGNDIGHVKDLAVRPEARGLGLGRRLLLRALTAMAIAGAAVVKLEVRVSNEPARQLYESVGFEPARRIPRYYGDGEDAFIMVVDLHDWQSG
ncbi:MULTISPECIES: ribosomal protein S18-alanine N-acetyltransferase [Haloferax]|uniref:Ribosomal-protein-alanine N-acetyltransferase n=1 Tax=Haloferax marinum TaxID=2666143 RepID=A0A6A8G7Y4_9EURY|nr:MULTISPECIES: ribosomal protein S18-alanine N-acetyltransferase [Haloferax]KAB1198061.1 ribosomal-protein-alanine N-acetyltransferase [Haloferax sp. CBA1150]MRW97131.1 ribosomal-protein-alanine N-acetyltransferase [Haloferax marinum]